MLIRLFLSLFFSLFFLFAQSTPNNIYLSDKHLENDQIQLLDIAEDQLVVFLSEGKHLKLDPGQAMDNFNPAYIKIIYIEDTLMLEGLDAFYIPDPHPGYHSLSITYYDEELKPIYHMEFPDQVTFRTVVRKPLITNDAVVLGILVMILALIFKTASMDKFKRFYTYVPKLLLCYFIPSILNSLGIISGELSALYPVAAHFMLPASLILLCLSIDLKGVFRLGPKALIMFLSGTLGIIIGGPLAIMLVASFSPDIFSGEGSEEVWRGMSTVAGSWIGGGANQAAMKEIFEPSERLFAASIAVDVIIANLWMAFLLFGAGMAVVLDRKLKADNSAIQELQIKMEDFAKRSARIPDFSDIMIILGIGLGGTAIAHIGADLIVPYLDVHRATLDRIGLTSLIMPFFWLVVIATTIGLILSFTRMRSYEGAGASKFGSLFLYMLVATIGMKMDLTAVADNLGLYLIGFIWMMVHVVILISVAKLIRAPFFFVAVGSQANIGGAASAPIVASAFSPALAPVGVLLGVLGYALGTYGAIISAFLMGLVSP